MLDDVIVENLQAIEMTQIYRDILKGTRELMSTFIDNRLNNIMKLLAAITIVMSIPTIISGLYGMNVNGNGMPFSKEPWGFMIICVLTLVICIVVTIVLQKEEDVVIAPGCRQTQNYAGWHGDIRVEID